MPSFTSQPFDRTNSIAELNDRVRASRDLNARIVFSRNCLKTFVEARQLPVPVVQMLLIEAFSSCDFAEDCPERDFAEILFADRKVWMKIDYYDRDLQYGSDDPANANVTTRVMTILLPEDW